MNAAASRSALASPSGLVETDERARRRDDEAAARDDAAAADDAASERRDRLFGTLDPDAATVRAGAASDRARAAADRVLAARDRQEAALDRSRAREELERAHLDELTGAWRRGAGEAALRQEIARARRGDGRLVLAYLDVDGLKQTNDRIGHAAGDALLRNVIAALRASLRPYDPIVRVGGDEFVCALIGVNVGKARLRFDGIARALRGGSVTVGLTSLEPDDTLADLIRRGDAELRRIRQAR